MLRNLKQYEFNPFKFSKFKYLRAVQFVSTMYQRIYNILCSLFNTCFDCAMRRKTNQEKAQEKVEHCIIWVVTFHSDNSIIQLIRT